MFAEQSRISPLPRRGNSVPLPRPAGRGSGSEVRSDRPPRLLDSRALAVGIDPPGAIRALDGASAAFGRLERTRLDGRDVVLALVKNPTSMAESVRMAAAVEPEGVLIGLNDEAADGRDVSWIWDVELDRLRRVPVFGLTGTRADDLALRLKYDGLTRIGGPTVDVDPNVESALAKIIARIRPGGTLVVLATYTALLAIRARLQRLGVVAPIPR